MGGSCQSGGKDVLALAPNVIVAEVVSNLLRSTVGTVSDKEIIYTSVVEHVDEGCCARNFFFAAVDCSVKIY